MQVWGMGKTHEGETGSQVLITQTASLLFALYIRIPCRNL